VKRPCALGRVAAQRDDLGHAGLGVARGDLQRFFAGGVDAGQMRRDGHAVILVDRLDRIMGERTRRAAGAIGDGDELRVEGARTPSVSQSLKEASSDLGGKNSKETWGRHGDSDP
jgi:hypothetical protein